MNIYIKFSNFSNFCEKQPKSRRNKLEIYNFCILKTSEDPMSEFRLSVVFYCAVNRTFQELPCSTAKIFFSYLAGHEVSCHDGIVSKIKCEWEMSSHLHWKVTQLFRETSVKKKVSNFYWVVPRHGSNKWIIMLEKWGRPDINVFHIKWIIAKHGNWKNQNPGGRFGATS